MTFNDDEKARGQVNSKLRRKQLRDTHAQTLDESSLASAPEFTGCQFVAYVQGRDVRFDNKGNMMVTFTIPPEFMEYALTIRSAFLLGAPLSVDVQVWEPYTKFEVVE